MNDVIVVTVTYNSSMYLERLMQWMDKQTYKVSKVIVVDNASNAENAEKNRKLAEKYPYMILLRSEENLGGAGGFEKGMRYVFNLQIDCDWIWLMDDDAFPTVKCLEKLLKHRNLDNIGCLCPVIYGIDLNKYQLFHHKLVSKYLNYDISIANSYDELEEISCLEGNAFVGPLIRASVVRELGFPDGELFIYGDDTEYTYRISRKYTIYLVKEAVINHRDMNVSSNIGNVSAIWKNYYKYRNRIIFINKYKSNAISGFVGKMLIIKAVLKEMGGAILHWKDSKIKVIRIKYLFKAMLDGFFGREGKTVDPAAVTYLCKMKTKM